MQKKKNKKRKKKKKISKNDKCSSVRVAEQIIIMKVCTKEKERWKSNTISQ